MKPSKRPPCEICGERATREATIQVDWFRGNDAVYPLCDNNVCRDTLRERECGTTKAG